MTEKRSKLIAKDEISANKTEQSHHESNLSEFESSGTKTQNIKHRNTINLKVDEKARFDTPK